MKMESILASKGPNVVTIDARATLRDAVTSLAANNIGALVVLDAARAPIGILSERDIIREASYNEAFLSAPVSRVMTRNVVCGAPGDDVDAVMTTMTTERFRHLPIVDNGQLVGIVSIGDLVKAELKQSRGDLETLQTQLMSS